jgi:hypothetical protein
LVEVQQGLTDEELRYLERSELIAEEGPPQDLSEDPIDLVPAGYRERLAAGDLSW